MSPEPIAVTRDIVIILFGVLGMACAITITVLVMLMYRKMARALDAIRLTAEVMGASAAVVSRAAGSLVTGAGVGSVLTWVASRLLHFGGRKKAD